MAYSLTRNRTRDTRNDTSDYDTAEDTAVTSPVVAHRQNVAARVIWFIAGVILTLLAFRFVFVLLGANPNSGFADFIYSASRPFVEPFFGIFNYDFQAGKAHFEFSTLVAMAVYAVVAAGLARLVTITRD
jgi:uncharacterized protein YggT (Ycf19 family)